MNAHAFRRAARVVGAAAILSSFAFLSTSANAQRGSRYVPPGGSPFSPYLELYRPNPGLLNQYYQFMIPRIQVRDTFAQQQGSITALQREVQTFQGQLQPLPTPAIGPTGVGAGFMNYSHYYSGQPRSGGRR